MIRRRHDSPYEADTDPSWWPAENTTRLIEGKYGVLFGQLCRVFKDRRRAARIILRVVLGEKK
jgi:hypothetical protein